MKIKTVWRMLWRAFLLCLDVAGFLALRFIGVQTKSGDIPRRAPLPVSVGSLRCPRCSAPLSEIEDDARWMRFWRCDDCLATFHFEGRELVQGRTPRFKTAAKARHHGPLVDSRQIIAELGL